MSENGFKELREIHELDELVGLSTDRVVILFKHSDSCGVSARAYREMARLEQPVSIVTVQNARPVSNEIERRFVLPHETPQVLVVRYGKLAWSASHFQVTADRVNRAIQEAAGEQRGHSES